MADKKSPCSPTDTYGGIIPFIPQGLPFVESEWFTADTGQSIPISESTEPFVPVGTGDMTPFVPVEAFIPKMETAPCTSDIPFRPVGTGDTTPFVPVEPFTPEADTTSCTPDTSPHTSQIEMVYDVVIVGAGASGLSTAIRIKQMAQDANTDISVCVLEKGADVGAHIMSGAVLEPRALNELFPDWQDLGAPLDCPAVDDTFLFLTKNRAVTLPVPPQMHNTGNYIISLGKFCKWLAKQAESMGVEIYTGVTAHSVICDDDNRIIGIQTGDMGIEKDGTKGTHYTAGMRLMATYSVFGEGCRGSMSEHLIKTYDLRSQSAPQTYGIGLKEVWEIAPENATAGHILHTVGWPLDSKTYGGSFLYHLQDNTVAIGFVVGLDYENPHMSPYMEFQRFKHHPAIQKILQGGRRISYGARALNEGGYQSIPQTAFPGGVMVGCSAGFLNVPKIKGTHTAMKSGMIAGETIARAILAHDTPAVLEAYPQALKQSWVYQELYTCRNIRPSFHKGLWAGMIYSAIDTYILRGKAPWTFTHTPDYTRLKSAIQCKKIDYPKPDGILSFDRLTNVAFSNTFHTENQPSHLKLHDDSVPIAVNLKLYDAPEQRYCPAGVYEIVKRGDDMILQINAQNCLHCKTCDIKDPTQNIQWTCPEGGGGPAYNNM